MPSIADLITEERRKARRPMKERAAIGTTWRRKSDDSRWRVVQSHRVDRLAELVPDDGAAGKAYVAFHVLRRSYEEVGGA